ncbi:glycosyltransferase family 4 protein, partial [Shimia sp.]|uniref:glycosyltransferase family 4 protein n=1 Tax=Shimia sp. TaxID=1954381 RepID=UPI00356855BE
LRDLRSWGAEMVHLHTPWTPMLAWQIWRGLRLPSVATFHATLPEGGGFDPFRAYIRFAARYFHKRLDAIVVPSEAPRAQWRALGVDPLPAILPPVIDLARWRAARQARPTGPHLLFMGRLEERKGVRVLLEAWPAIAAALPGARLTIAGAGALEAPLRKMAEVAALRDVTFLPPPSRAGAPALVASADFFVAPATGGESFGLVLTEAMAAGALPVAAANAGYATVMNGAGRDLLVPPGDSAALSAKVIELARDPALCKRLARWADQRAAAFDVAAVGPRFLSLYETALTARK